MKELLNYIEQLKRIVPVSSVIKNAGPIVFIDPGHGGLKNGKYTTAPNKMVTYPDFTFYEGVYNRALAWSFAYFLHTHSYNYAILVTEDDDITLMERVRRAEKLKKEYWWCYYHSIHGNAAPKETKASGIEVYTSPGQTKSDVLATIYYQKLAQLGWNMRPGMGDGDPDKEEKFYVLKETSMPAILTENGFYTNYCEAILMKMIETINDIAKLFFQAHLEIIKLDLL